jgi:hypothetical protein
MWHASGDLVGWAQGYASQSSVDLVVLRKESGLAELAVQPLTHFPLLLDDMVNHLAPFVETCDTLFIR